MSRPAPDILCLGEAMVEFSAPPRGGVEQGWIQGFGGDTSNCAVAAARQGGRVGYISAVGDDPFGAMLVEMWTREGIDTTAVLRDPSAPTGVYFITHGASGHAFSYLRAGSAASRLTPAALPRQMIGKARVLHLSGISQAISASGADTAFEAMAVARAAGVLVSYDTNLRLRLWPLPRARAVIMAAVAEADIVLPGLEDARQLTGLDDADAIADRFLAGHARVVALTLGKEGALVATRERRERIGSLPVAAIDASGAGDCFDGAFLVEYLRTGDAYDAGRYACAAAALST
ncbi:MAG TPA: sugar kinase, partial [Hyphomicrobiaceae bacterium]|nr:sugar kinase [Hyphomicrobiaceae bacterium]